MSSRKSRPPITYANTLDKPQAIKRAQSTHPSPSSARPSFNGQKLISTHQKTKQTSQTMSPNAQPVLQPKGMGEQGVNWNTHIMRLRKARKAVRKSRTSSNDFNHEKSAPDLER